MTGISVVNFEISSCTKFQIPGRESAPDPVGGAYSATLDPIAGGVQKPNPRSQPFWPQASAKWLKLCPLPVRENSPPQRKWIVKQYISFIVF